MTPADLRAARKALGLTQHGLAEALRMGKSGWQSVSRWEKDGNSIPGPVQVAVEALVVAAQGIETAKPPRRAAGLAREGESPVAAGDAPNPDRIGEHHDRD